MAKSKLSLFIFSSWVVVSANASFSKNLRPYYENGKLNSPMVATFIPVSASYIKARPDQPNSDLSLAPRSLPISLQELLSPQQYSEYLQYRQRPVADSQVGQFRLPSFQQFQLATPATISPLRTAKRYNTKYPFTPPVTKFRIGVVSDLDASSMSKSGEIPKNWDALLKEGSLSVQYNANTPEFSKVTIDWTTNRTYNIRSGFNYASRGMELSTLNVFNGAIYSCDDKTGIIYELPLDKLAVDPVPWSILADGNFTGPQGFKCEWGTIKEEHLWIGGHGTLVPDQSNSSTLKKSQKFVKKISMTGEITHLDWSTNYDKMTQVLGVQYPGYVKHESAGWSDILQKWVFIPRAVSKVKFSEADDKKAGSNVVIMADENFDNVQVTRIGNAVPALGFASFKWIPGTHDHLIVAIKTSENGTRGESFITAFNLLDGTILLKDTKFADQKYEGIEFI